MKKRFNRKGFTLAEVLIVVAIIVVLMGVGAVALFSHMRNMQKLEMDGQAKELFIAAQNHLSLAESQGFLGVAEYEGDVPTDNFGTPDPDGADSTIPGVYYIIVNGGAGSSTFSEGKGSAVLNQMLPFASMDESARAGGSYIIRYQKEPAQILDVFYVSKSGRYGLENGFSEADYLNYLKGYIGGTSSIDLKSYGSSNAVVGYYGGNLPATLVKGQDLLVPTVTIYNEETLYVEVTNPNTGVNDGDNALVLVISGSGNQVSIPLVDNNGDNAYDHGTKTTRVSDNNNNVYTIILDDVTNPAMHFGSTATDKVDDFATAGIKPGDNITIQAIAYTNKALAGIAQSAPQTTNSLFASRSGNTVEISYVRHLLNLDKAVSKLNTPPTTANQTRDLTWDGFKTGVEMGTTKVISVLDTDGGANGQPGDYRPVNLDYKLAYNGQGHSITGITIENESSASAVGLFSAITGVSATEPSSVTDLRLVDFSLKTTSGNAGALAAGVTYTDITGVLVHNSNTGNADDSAYYIQTGTGNAGGLVGSMSGGKIDKSAAAVYVKASGSAGGLVGVVSGSAPKIYSSYSGGHTFEAEYRDNDDTVADKQDGRLNVIGGTVAGGLIGDASAATNLDLKYSYSTCSASAATAGGLIGKGGSGTVAYCYATGLVYGGTTMDTFVGSDFSSLSFTTITTTDPETHESVTVPTNYYLEGVSEISSGIAATALTGATAGDSSLTKFLVPDGSQQAAIAYDVKVGGRYAFPTIDQLHTLYADTGWTRPSGFEGTFLTSHYGDWQMPTMEILNYTLTNSDTLFTDITLKEHTRFVTMVVYGETSEAATAFLLELSDDQSDARVINSGTLVDKDIIWRGADSVILPRFSVNPDTKIVNIVLDDITDNSSSKKQHFASIFPNLIPGENITLFAAGGKCSWAELNTLRTKTYPEGMPKEGEIIALSDNSLFAKPSRANFATTLDKICIFGAGENDYYPVEIQNIRHLQNLDTATSNVNNGVAAENVIIGAKLINNIDWADKKWNGKESESGDDLGWKTKKIYQYNSTTSTDAGRFNGLCNTALKVFDGNNKTIKGMIVEKTFGQGAGNAGFFRRVDNAELTIKNLHLEDPTITAQTLSGDTYAGAFVGYSNGVLKLNTVLAEGSNSCVSTGKGAAGGLVGSSVRDLEIENSAAAVYVNASGAAGGLVGEQTGNSELKITTSYVGGHTYEGLYYVGEAAQDPDTGHRWNIISTGGAAGGLLGLLSNTSTATIDHSFNAASVYCGNLDVNGAGGIIGVANGDIESSGGSPLNLVYVVAPVCGVNEIHGTIDGLVAEAGNAGSIIGVSSDGIAGSSTPGQGIFFLPNVYTSPLPTMLESEDGSVSNIKTIGDGELSNVKLAYYYARPGRDNVILPFASDSLSTMEQMTKPFDGTLGEYPFAIWTQFAFEGSSINYFYGDWQPAEKGPSIHVDVEFYTVLEADESDPASVREVKHLTERDQVIAAQIPYEPISILLPWPEDIFGYDFGDWVLYYGDQSAAIEAGESVPASAISEDGSFTSVKNGTNVPLSTAEFKKANQEIYRTTDESGQEHLHITLVSTYQPKEHKPYKLEFYDMKFAENADGEEEPDGYEADPLTYQVLEPRPDEDRTQLSQLVDGKQPPTRAKAGYRFLGWYTKEGETYTAVYENTYNAEENSFKLVLNETNAAAITVDHDVKLYARYAPIAYRTLTVRFIDSEGNEIPSVEAYPIQFEGDRGFKETVLPLPYEADVLWPNTDVEPTVTPTGTDAVITWLLTGTAPTVTVAVPAAAEVTDANREIECKITYNVNAEYTGYAVIYEFMDTGADGNTYAAEQSYVHKVSSFNMIATETYLYGTTIKGFSPDVDVKDDDRFTSYMKTIQPAGFEISGDKFVKQDKDGNLPEKYAGKYPTKVKNSAGEEADVTCLVVIQCKRKANWLTFDSNGGTNIAPVKMVYGRKLNDILKDGEGNNAAAYVPTYASYTFIKWVYKEGEQEKDVTNDTTMPDRDLELLAKREGAPVPFTVLLMEQDPNNEDNYTVSEIYTDYTKQGRTNDFMANAGSDVSVTLDSDSKKAVLSWTNGTASENTTYTMLSVNSEYQYFNLNSAMTDAKVTVSDDGSTVVKIYLDRNFYSVWFRIGRASNAKVSKKVGKFDDEAGTHELFEYIRPNGEHFWAYEDEVVGVPYGTENNRWFELTKDTKDVPVYTPKWEYYEDDDGLFGLVGHDYVELSKKTTSGYVVADGYQYTVSSNDYDNNPEKFGIFGNNGGTIQRVYWKNGAFRQGNGNWSTVYSGTRYTRGGTSSVPAVGEAYEEGTPYYIAVGGFTATKPNNYNKTVYGKIGDCYFPIESGTVTAYYYNNGSTEYKDGPHFSRRPYSGTDVYTEDDLTLRSDGNLWYDDENGYVETESAGTKTVPIFKRKDTEEIYDHNTKPVKYFVIITNPKDINVQDVVPTTNTKYFVSIYGSNGYAWDNEYNGVTTRLNAAWNNNPFTWIPSKNLRLEGPETSNGDVYFYYCICARFGADISKVWPDVNWLNGEGRNAGIMGLVETSNGNRIRDYKFTSWLFPSTSRYYYLHSSTMTSIKGPYATMSEELILKRNSSNSTTFFDTPDNGTGNNPSVILYGRYRHNESNGRPNWWNYVLHFGIGGLNPNPNALDTRNPAHWRTVEVHVYSDGPSGNQNPIEYQGYKTPAKNDTTHWTPQSQQYTGASTTQWKDIDYYYIPEVKHILFNAKDDPEGQYDVIADDSYFYGTHLTIADIHSDEVNVPSGYVFKGWYQNSLGEGTAFDFDSDIHGELILYAVVEPVDKSVTFTLTKPEGCEADPVWAEGGSEDRTFTGIKHKSTLTAALTEDGRSFTPKLEGYRFVGWVEQEEPHTPFAPSQQIIKNYTLIPSWEKLPEPVKINVTVYYVEQDDPDKEVHASTTEEAVVDDSHKFTALSIGGYKPVKSYYYETIDSMWMEEHLVTGTTDSYAFTIEYVPSENDWNYTVEYRLYLAPVGGGTPIGIPISSDTQTSSSNFTSASFFSLPEGLEGYKFHSLELYEGFKEGETVGTKVDSTTDPVIFVRKADGVKLVVNVVPDDSYFLKGDVVRIYNTKSQGVDEEFEGSLPDLPAGAGLTRSITYRYYLGGRLVNEPINVGAYNVETEVTVAYNGTNYFFWKSASGTGSRPDVVLYIDRCDVLLTSRSVTNMFLDNDENRRDIALLPSGYKLVDIAKDTNVDISGVSDDVLAKLNDGLLISPSADAFRRAGSTGPEAYTLNVFACEMSTAADNGNFNFYKTYGKIYLWKNLDAYNAWKATQPATGG